jgi:hypothetical protein
MTILDLVVHTLCCQKWQLKKKSVFAELLAGVPHSSQALAKVLTAILPKACKLVRSTAIVSIEVPIILK